MRSCNWIQYLTTILSLCPMVQPIPTSMSISERSFSSPSENSVPMIDTNDLIQRRLDLNQLVWYAGIYPLGAWHLYWLLLHVSRMIPNLNPEQVQAFPTTIQCGKVGWQFGCEIHPVTKEYIKLYFKKRADWVRNGYPPTWEREWYRVDGTRRCWVRMLVDKKPSESGAPRDGGGRGG